jgi:hypothetical protein
MNFAYMDIVNRAPTIGAITGGLSGALDRGQSYTNPTTGETFYQDTSVINRGKKIIGNTAQGALLGVGVKLGGNVYNDPERMNQIRTTVSNIRTKLNTYNQ